MNYENVYNLYLQVSSKVFDGGVWSPSACTSLMRSFEFLRQSLSCYVCYQLLRDPYSSDSNCQHYLCRRCVGGKLKLPDGGRPSCSMCRDPASFTSDHQLKLLLNCFACLCQYMETAPDLAALRMTAGFSAITTEAKKWLTQETRTESRGDLENDSRPRTIQRRNMTQRVRKRRVLANRSRILRSSNVKRL